jgi:hypothetical protein
MTERTPYQRQPLDRRMGQVQKTKRVVEALDPRLTCDRTTSGLYSIVIKTAKGLEAGYAETDADALRVARELIEKQKGAR